MSYNLFLEKASLFQQLIGLNHFTESLLRAAIATICVRMVFFDEFLVARLDIVGRRAGRQPKSLESFALQRLQFPLRGILMFAAVEAPAGEAEGITHLGRAGARLVHGRR